MGHFFFWVMSHETSLRSFTPKNLPSVLHSSSQAQPISWLIWRTAFSRPFHACIMTCKQDPDEENHLKKTQSHADHELCKHPTPLASISQAYFKVMSQNSRCDVFTLSKKSHFTNPPQEPSHHPVGFPQRDQWNSVFHLVCVEKNKQRTKCHSNIITLQAL